MADPAPPQPVPFPIRIVADPAPAPIDDLLDAIPTRLAKRNDEFYPAWSSFLSNEAKRAKRTSRSAKLVEDEKTAIAKGSSDGLKVEENAATSWEQAAAECRKKVEAIVEECKRLNQKYRDAIFDLEGGSYCLQSLVGRYPKAVDIDAPPWVKRVEDIFDNPQFFIDGATATDVHQRGSGDCWFLAALMAVSAKKELIDNLCVARDEKVGVYGFVFYRDGEWIHEVIDDKLFLRVGDDDDLTIVRDWDTYEERGVELQHDSDELRERLQRGGDALYFSHCRSNETWLPLIEKAYAKAHGDYASIEGGSASEGIEDLTGGVGVVINPEDIMDKDRFWRDQLMAVNEKYLFGGGSKPTTSKGVVGSHAYAVLETWEERDLRLLKIRNPWGRKEWEGDWSDGSKLWTADMMTKLGHSFGDDGVFWISYKDFLKHFPSINRVRLFDKEWSVSQQWTSVSVPWTVDYLDTKFEVTLDKKGPLVVVLSQPDDRYFYGLRGRYCSALHFRLYKDGENSYIVRSMHNSGNQTAFTRSVSAEVEDLEPGKYFVIFKVTAVRTSGQTAEEIVYNYALDKKVKLLHVGRRFDYAQSKGNLKGLEEANKKRRRDKRKDREKSRSKKSREVMQKEKERARKRRKRIEAAMREKRKALVERQNEKRLLKEQQQQQQQQQRGEFEFSAQGSDKATSGTPDGVSNEPKSAHMTTGEGKASNVDATSEAAKTPASEVNSKDHEAEETGNTSPERETETTTVDGKKEQTSPIAAEEGEKTGREYAIESIRKDIEKLGLQDGAWRNNIQFQDSSATGGGYESPPEQLSEMDDNDFDWDSDMDGPINSSNSSDGSSKSRRSHGLNVFDDDRWNCNVVLGLRVYCKGEAAKIRVLKDDDDEDDKVEEVDE